MGEEKEGLKTQQEAEIRIENTAGSNSPEVEMAKCFKERGHLDSHVEVISVDHPIFPILAFLGTWLRCTFQTPVIKWSHMISSP